MYWYGKNQLTKVTYCWPKKKNILLTKEKRWISTKLSHGGKKVIRFLLANVVYIIHAMLNKLRIYWVNIYTTWVRMCLYMSMHTVLFVSLLTMLAISHNSRNFCFLIIFFIYSVYVHIYIYSCVAYKYLICIVSSLQFWSV